ncbi:hypothetical protein JZ751_008345 [Albula glossodonta]|uniref:DNA-directed DNA polymerase family A palm domain-containing protein n=1 Tax=Albula glossodonta TaxID=121402 RepID=A0A8T2NCQ7_9TELE|nr:hypothetical protein JZ751_008345 [Albula glossodonta]
MSERERKSQNVEKEKQKTATSVLPCDKGGRSGPCLSYRPSPEREEEPPTVRSVRPTVTDRSAEPSGLGRDTPDAQSSALHKVLRLINSEKNTLDEAAVHPSSELPPGPSDASHSCPKNQSENQNSLMNREKSGRVTPLPNEDSVSTSHDNIKRPLTPVSKRRKVDGHMTVAMEPSKASSHSKPPAVEAAEAVEMVELVSESSSSRKLRSSEAHTLQQCALKAELNGETTMGQICRSVVKQRSLETREEEDSPACSDGFPSVCVGKQKQKSKHRAVGNSCGPIAVETGGRQNSGMSKETTKSLRFENCLTESKLCASTPTLKHKGGVGFGVDLGVTGQEEKCESPDLYAAGQEEFGDSFQLDTQTEKMMQQEDPLVSHSNPETNRRSTATSTEPKSSVSASGTRSPLRGRSTDENLAGKDPHLRPLEDEKSCKDSSNGCPREAPPKYNISLTDSQMEDILDYSTQGSDHQGETPVLVGKTNRHSSANQSPDGERERSEVAVEAILDGSSSFLFDGLNEDSLLDEGKEGGGDTDVDANHLPSAQKQVQPEDESPADDWEADLWGESSFNLSEWGDSLQIGEAFLNRLTTAHRSVSELTSGPNTDSHHPSVGLPMSDSTRRAKQVNPAVSTDKTPTESSFHLSPGLLDILDQWPSMTGRLPPSHEAPAGGAIEQNASEHTNAEPVNQKNSETSLCPKAEKPSDVRASRSEPGTLLVQEQNRPKSHNDLIPPTPEPVTPRIKMTVTTSSARSSPVTCSRIPPGPMGNPASTHKLTNCESPALQRHAFGPGEHNGETAQAQSCESELKLKCQENQEVKDSPPWSSPGTGPRIPGTVGNPVAMVTPMPTSDLEFCSDSSLVEEGFTLQLSQDSPTSDPTPPPPPPPSSLPSSPEAFSIIDVASDRCLFHTFVQEWRTKGRFSLAVACEKRERPKSPKSTIGGKFQQGSAHVKRTKNVDGFPVRGNEVLVVTGVSVCWGGKDAYYVSLLREQPITDVSASLAPPPLDESLSVSDRLKQVQTCLKRSHLSPAEGAVVTYDLIQVYKTLLLACGVTMEGSFEDPKVACWLLDPSSKERTLHNMVANFAPAELPLLDGIGPGQGVHSLGIGGDSDHTGRYRAAVESVLVYSTMVQLCVNFVGRYVFCRVEMPALGCLALLELNGIGFSTAECETQKHVMQAKLAALEAHAYQLAGHAFSLTRPDDIAEVLFLELKLPPNGDLNGLKNKKTLGYARRTTAGNKVKLAKQFSTTKDVLEKLKPLHPLPGVILEWRRITNAMTKVVFPLQREKRWHPLLEMERIYPVSQTHTATGRVSFTEPNIQNVPKDFEIRMPTLVGESPPSQERGKAVLTKPGYEHGQQLLSRRSKMHGELGSRVRGPEGSPEKGLPFSVSMRHAFVPFPGGLILAADYSQLELRILAHLSRDRRLLQVLNSGADVFRSIAAEWRMIEPGAVDDALRQQAKQLALVQEAPVREAPVQGFAVSLALRPCSFSPLLLALLYFIFHCQICYGIIYGMGAKSLGEQMGIEENDAACYIETFKSRYTVNLSLNHDLGNYVTFIHSCEVEIDFYSTLVYSLLFLNVLYN